MMNRIMTVMNLRRLFILMLFLSFMDCLMAQEKAEMILRKPRRPILLTRVGEKPVGLTEKANVPELAPKKQHYTFATILDGDTIPYIYLKEVNVWGSYLLLTKKEINKNGKLIRNVKIMLPYAREAKRRLDVLEVEIAQMSPKERKAALKKAEKDIEAEYKKDLKKRLCSSNLLTARPAARPTLSSRISVARSVPVSIRLVPDSSDSTSRINSTPRRTRRTT